MAFLEAVLAPRDAVVTAAFDAVAAIVALVVVCFPHRLIRSIGSSLSGLVADWRYSISFVAAVVAVAAAVDVVLDRYMRLFALDLDAKI